MDAGCGENRGRFIVPGDAAQVLIGHPRPHDGAPGVDAADDQAVCGVLDKVTDGVRGPRGLGGVRR